MGLADYFGRTATAASQVLTGFDESGFRERVASIRIALSFGTDSSSPEGRLLTELVVRLVARFYGQIVFRADTDLDHVDTLVRLAASINPNLEFADGPLDAQISVGLQAPPFDGRTIYVGSNGWDALVSCNTPQPVGVSANPLGAGAAASLGVGALFRALFLTEAGSEGEPDVTLSTRLFTPTPTGAPAELPSGSLNGDVHVVGLGAVGNSVIWALSALPLDGTIRLIDHESIELSNLQRYVLASVDDIGSRKVDVASRVFPERAKVVPLAQTWQEFAQDQDTHVRNVVVALDSAKDRMAIQASLPEWIANAWTQPGDLGVSIHSAFGDRGACLNCLYLPTGVQTSEDEVIARALGVPDRIMQVRELLFGRGPVPPDLAEAVARSLGLEADIVSPFIGRPLRELYVEGVCGGAVLPLGRAGTPHSEVHVPMAHQSSLAGILLAAALVQRLLDGPPNTTTITRLNLLKPPSGKPTQLALQDPRGICICQDADYVNAYRDKFGLPTTMS